MSGIFLLVFCFHFAFSQFQYQTEITLYPKNYSETDFFLSFYHSSNYDDEDICFKYSGTKDSYIPFFIEKRNENGINGTIGIWLQLTNFTKGEPLNITFYHTNDDYLNEDCYQNFYQELGDRSFFLPNQNGCNQENGFFDFEIDERYIMIDQSEPLEDAFSFGGSPIRQHTHSMEGFMEDDILKFYTTVHYGEGYLYYNHHHGISTSFKESSFGDPSTYSIPFCAFSFSPSSTSSSYPIPTPSPFSSSSTSSSPSSSMDSFVPSVDTVTSTTLSNLPNGTVILMEELPEEQELLDRGLVHLRFDDEFYFLRHSLEEVSFFQEHGKHSHISNSFESSSSTGVFFKLVQTDSDGLIPMPSNQHTHILEVGLEETPSPIPPHIQFPAVVIIDSDGIDFMDHMLLFSNSSIIPYGYKLFKKENLDFEGKLIRIGSKFQYSDVYKYWNHNHTAYLENVEPNSMCFTWNANFENPSPSNVVCNHNHSYLSISSMDMIDVHTDSDDSDYSELPPFFKLRLFERKESDCGSFVFGETKHIKWYCNGIVVSDPNVCSNNGVCLHPNETSFCQCDPNSYGIDCAETISGKGFYETKNIIKIEYDITVETIFDISTELGYEDLQEGKGDVFDCSYLIENASLVLGEDSKCGWIVEALTRTKYLKIENVDSSKKIHFLKIYPFTIEERIMNNNNNNSVVFIQIEQFTDDEDDDHHNKEEQSGVALGIVLSISFSSILLSFCALCLLFLPIMLFFILILLALLLFLSKQQMKLRKLEKIPELDLLLKENEEMKNRTIAHLKINKSLFEVDLSEIKIQKEIGFGATSIVYKCLWKSRICAFKMYKAGNQIFDDESLFKDLQNEVFVLSNTNHPNILRYYGGVLRPPKIGILVEFCGNGDLHTFVEKQNEFLDDEEKVRIFIEISSAMSYLHSRNIIHRDLKPENILINDKVESRLMDFGFSKVTQKLLNRKEMTRMVGSTFYMSPEIIQGNEYDEKCDVFSFGILLFCIETGNFDPFQHETGGVEYRIASDPSFRPNISKEIEKGTLKNDPLHQQLIKIMKNCWNHQSENRPSFDEILNTLMNFNEEIIKEEQDQEQINDQKERIRTNNNNKRNQIYSRRLSIQLLDFEKTKKEIQFLKKQIQQEKEKNEKLLEKNRKLLLHHHQQERQEGF